MFASSLKGFLMLLWSDTKRHTPLHLLVSTRLHRGGIHCNQSHKYSVGATDDSLMARVIHLAEFILGSVVATTDTRHACLTIHVIRIRVYAHMDHCMQWGPDQPMHSEVHNRRGSDAQMRSCM